MRADTEDAHHAVATPDAKAFENLRARCALAGVALTRSTDDHDRPMFVVSRWALTKTLPDMASVAQWLTMVTGKTE
jgi:hypothetical protein